MRTSDDLMLALADRDRARSLKMEHLVEAALAHVEDEIMGVKCTCGSDHAPRPDCYVHRVMMRYFRGGENG